MESNLRENLQLSKEHGTACVLDRMEMDWALSESAVMQIIARSNETPGDDGNYAEMSFEDLRERIPVEAQEALFSGLCDEYRKGAFSYAQIAKVATMLFPDRFKDMLYKYIPLSHRLIECGRMLNMHGVQGLTDELKMHLISAYIPHTYSPTLE
jgi:hypothetical protein